MLIFVTGGTGFVGSHSVAAVLRAGGSVRLLARDPAAVGPALRPLGVDPGAVEVVTGDATDPELVGEAVRGCDALLHAASLYSFDPRRAAEIRRVNARSTEVVLDAGVQAGVERIVHVSSIVAMYPAEGRMIDADSPVGRARDPYLAGKAASERIARRHQDLGAPVAITYPPALLGPHDPRLGDQTARLRDILRGLMPMWPGGGFPVGDVRDTAALHAQLLTRGESGGGRYFGPGRYVSTRELVRTVRQVTGRPLPTVFLPARSMLPVGVLAGWAQRIWPWHIPAEYGAVYICACATRVAEDADTGAIGARATAETIGDAVRWMYQNGHITARQAGVAAVPPGEERHHAQASA